MLQIIPWLAFVVVSIILILYVVYMQYREREYERFLAELLKDLKDVSRKKSPYVDEMYMWKLQTKLLREAYLKQRAGRRGKNSDEVSLSFYRENLISDEHNFLQDVDKRFNGVIQKLKLDYSSLNTKELLFIILYLLDIPDHDICLILGYSIYSLPTIKNRLCKKLSLDHANKLNNFLYDYISRL